MKGQTNQNIKNNKCLNNKKVEYVQTTSGIVCKLKKDNSVVGLIEHKKRNKKNKGAIKSVVNCLCMLFSVVVFYCLCITVFNSVFYKLKPTFFGFATCKVVTASMVNSGFNVNDKVIVRAVDTSTLRGARVNENGEKIWGDIIAFYVDPDNQTDVSEFNQITNFDYDIKYIGWVGSIFNVPSTRLRQLAKSKAPIFFHHIEDVYVDSSGKRWFSTRGSNNFFIDQETINTEEGQRYLNSGYVSEDVILGVFDENANTKSLARSVTNIAESKAIVPVFVILIVLLLLVGLSDVFTLIISYYYTAKLLDGNLSPTDAKIKKFRIYENLSDYEKLQILQDFPVEQSAEIIANLFFVPQEMKETKKEEQIKSQNKKYKSKNPNYNELKRIYAKKRIQLLKESKKDN